MATKAFWRSFFASRRQYASLSGGEGRELSTIFLRSVCLSPGTVVAGYVPLPYEVDTMPLLEACAALGCVLALPVVTGADSPLLFRRWRCGDPLEKGAYGIPIPPKHHPTVTPDLLLVPLLAFTREGDRLGYGGGFYDRTLSSGTFCSVGLAYSFQEAAYLPVEFHDRPLDAVVTDCAFLAVRDHHFFIKDG